MDISQVTESNDAIHDSYFEKEEYKLFKQEITSESSYEDKSEKKHAPDSDITETKIKVDSPISNSTYVWHVAASAIKEEISDSMLTHNSEHSNVNDEPINIIKPSGEPAAFIEEEGGDVKKGSCVCSLCHRRCRCQSALLRHMMTHRGEKPYSCTVCSKSFSNSGNLTTHMRLHTGEKPFSCTVCSKSFVKLGNLTAHMRMHTGDKPFSCTECSKSFSESGTLTKHLRIHTGEKPFTCPLCNELFTYSVQLRRHMQRHT